MRTSRCLLVLLVALAFGLSFAIPAEDMPETAYDESEALPYEATPLFSIVLQESARTQSVLTSASPLHFSPLLRRAEIQAEWSERAEPQLSVSVTILDHSLRC